MKLLRLENGNKCTVGVFMRKAAKYFSDGIKNPKEALRKENKLMKEFSDIYHEQGFNTLQNHIKAIS